MKPYFKTVLVIILTILIKMLNAQTINWAADKKNNKNLLYLKSGIEFGTIYEAGYGIKIFDKLQCPGYATITYSFPSGTDLFDDFKTQIGANFNIIKSGNFYFNTNATAIFRNYNNDLVRLMNFGAYVAGNLGYYRKHGFFALEAGFDKAIVTNFKHNSEYKTNFPNVVDGWYEPPAGGIFNFGISTGASFSNSDINIRAGKFYFQDLKASPLVPLYATIGYNFKF